MEFGRKRHQHTHMNVAPLVDVIFLLLLFFMLATHFIQEPAIRIRLPESKSAEATNESPRTVFITKGGEIYFSDKRVGLKDLREAIKKNLNDVEKSYLRIKADREVSIGLLVSVIDEVKLSGIRNFSLGTERR